MDFSELKAVMVRKNVKYRELSSRLGISLQSFYNKIEGKTEFKLAEVRIIIVALDLSPEEADKIFLSLE